MPRDFYKIKCHKIVKSDLLIIVVDIGTYVNK